ncbi:amidohydrolase [Paenibacillus selenitireducens]|uniref:Amidohydrolase n=1 Tax=Paenibacillus selenitireducens TaxID=1324314 RepID=A0A1T2XCY9_9BACL|nr:amidohydrolase family protein [Paenibacillus selenitireducens]OPA77751.1 amidohydrolase [Paenibacillus selenitireducens]
MKMRRIDAHQHYWSLQRDDYGWITPELPVLYRNYLPDDLEPHLQDHQIDGTIVVQAAATLAETDYMLELAASTERILGVVGWLDVLAPDYQEQLARFQQHPKFVGVRIMIQEMEDSDEVLTPGYFHAMKYFAEIGLPVDLLCKSTQLHSVVELLRIVPDLHAVIDHIAKPQIAAQVYEPWKSQMAEIASNPHIYCKLSGMVTEADHQAWKREQITEYIQHAINLFGKERIMFGSDWPVCLLAADYDEVIQLLEQSLDTSFTEEDRAKLFGSNAASFYRLT